MCLPALFQFAKFGTSCRKAKEKGEGGGDAFLARFDIREGALPTGVLAFGFAEGGQDGSRGGGIAWWWASQSSTLATRKSDKNTLRWRFSSFDRANSPRQPSGRCGCRSFRDSLSSITPSLDAVCYFVLCGLRLYQQEKLWW